MTTSAIPGRAAASDADLQAVANLRAARGAIKSELAKVIVGQEQVIDEILRERKEAGHG